MQFILVSALIFALLVAVFAISNANEVIVKFPWGSYPISQAVVILGSAAVGSVVVLLLGLFSQIKLRFKLWEFQGRIKKLEKEIQNLQEENEKYREMNFQNETVNHISHNGKNGKVDQSPDATGS
jgi:uncharacterized integral membrane protein